MNEQHITGQIHDSILNNRFEASCRQSESGQECQPGVAELIKLSIQKKMSVPSISSGALDRAMGDTIEKFTRGEYNVPDLVVRAKHTSKARDMLQEQAGTSEAWNKGRFVLASIEGEYHRHGKDIVASLLRGLGFDIVDLGQGASVPDIVGAVAEQQPDYLGISGSTFSTVPLIQELADRLARAGCREETTFVLGGYLALTESPDSLGVDHCCPNITKTIDLLKTFADSAAN